MLRLTGRFDRDHRALRAHLRVLDAALLPVDPERIRTFLRFTAGSMVMHRRCEEEALFPELLDRIERDVVRRESEPRPAEGVSPEAWQEGHADALGAIARALEEHAELETLARRLARLLDRYPGAGVAGQIHHVGRRFQLVCERHMQREETILFPLANTLIPRGRRIRLQQQIASMHEAAAVSRP